MLHHENMVLQKADCMQDMHYADFAEDDVGFIEQINFGGEADSWGTERSFIGSYQGIRG